VIVRRRTWTYRPVDSSRVRQVTFPNKVSKQEAILRIVEHYRHLVAEIWAQ